MPESAHLELEEHQLHLAHKVTQLTNYPIKRLYSKIFVLDSRNQIK